MLTVLSFIGGLAFFLYGMSGMGKGLTKLSGGRMEALLARMCRSQVVRLREKTCTPEAGSAFSSFICDLESVAAHERRLTAIGMRRKGSAFDPLRPTRALREVDGAYADAYQRFAAKYRI